MSDAPARERILQFGTGRFLLGFVGDFVDRARRAGYDGKIVVVQSTGADRADLINRAEGRYTVHVRGQRDGVVADEPRIAAPFARALQADRDWDALCALARSDDLTTIVSNTTERGLALDAADTADRPVSFPARLAHLLIERHSAGKPGVVVLPCELLPDNGALLKELVVRSARAGGAGDTFFAWLEGECLFADSLVDRIVTAGEAEDGQMAVTTEPFALWAIAGNVELAERIGFAAACPEIVVTPDIAEHRLLKLRILNGGHTACAPLAVLAGHSTVGETMRDADGIAMVRRILEGEIAATLDLPADRVAAYVGEVIERWSNPFMAHRWRDILANHAMKIGHRLVETALAAHRMTGAPPPMIVASWAAYALLIERGTIEDESWPSDPADVAAHILADRAGSDVIAAFAAVFAEVQAALSRDPLLPTTRMVAPLAD